MGASTSLNESRQFSDAGGMWPSDRLSHSQPSRPVRPELLQARYLVDNRFLSSTSLGLAYRRSKHFEDVVGMGVGTGPCTAAWGSTVLGINEGDGWLRVGSMFLPMEANGVPVLTPEMPQMPAGLAPPPGNHPGPLLCLNIHAWFPKVPLELQGGLQLPLRAYAVARHGRHERRTEVVPFWALAERVVWEVPEQWQGGLGRALPLSAEPLELQVVVVVGPAEHVVGGTSLLPALLPPRVWHRERAPLYGRWGAIGVLEFDVRVERPSDCEAAASGGYLPQPMVPWVQPLQPLHPRPITVYPGPCGSLNSTVNRITHDASELQRDSLKARVAIALDHCNQQIEAGSQAELQHYELARSLELAEQEFDRLTGSWEGLQSELQLAQEALFRGHSRGQRHQRQRSTTPRHDAPRSTTPKATLCTDERSILVGGPSPCQSWEPGVVTRLWPQEFAESPTMQLASAAEQRDSWGATESSMAGRTGSAFGDILAEVSRPGPGNTEAILAAAEFAMSEKLTRKQPEPGKIIGQPVTEHRKSIEQPRNCAIEGHCAALESVMARLIEERQLRLHGGGHVDRARQQHQAHHHTAHRQPDFGNLEQPSSTALHTPKRSLLASLSAPRSGAAPDGKQLSFQFAPEAPAPGLRAERLSRPGGQEPRMLRA